MEIKFSEESEKANNEQGQDRDLCEKNVFSS